MRIVARNTLVEFWEKHPETKVSLTRWHETVKAAEWQSPNDIQQAFPKAKVLNSERVRFEVAGGDYQLIAAFDFGRQAAFVKFIGTHAEYDKIDALTVSLFLGVKPMVEINPIHNDADHKAAVAEIERLWGAAEGTPEGDKLDILLTLVDAYEEKRWPIEVADPVDALTYAIEEMGHTQNELANLLGSRSRASEILSRKRALTVEMIHKISSAWHIPPAILIRPYEIENAA